ncbi:ArsR/SmtB family transcription factor [Bowmanella yangjiangensis]|uniref:Winged helix-turn-helix transcriptional regulator n=1 Tax=Bowmanella yangjiangensis TaxID=2811230 RepID=A0ABS3CS38_9ALTE|nr:winged helix-turn-helix domain-containing protein [Bowmanella yangjiangensis]MBN7819937.1 winged helix-turn-helix transcriptional regulator [Bowmanella yangjiangensis]
MHTLTPSLPQIAALIGEPARASMLTALMAGKALTATELALEADISSQTASSHLAKLLNAGLLQVLKQGRHKYFRLHSAEVAALLESLLNLSVSLTPLNVSTGPQDPALRFARVCYDHLAGELGVRLYAGLLTEGLITEQDTQASLTEKGVRFFEGKGCDVERLRRSKRPLCRACLDWSERRHHLAGSLGYWLLQDVMSKGWVTRQPDSRALLFSPSGKRALCKHYPLQTRAC